MRKVFITIIIIVALLVASGSVILKNSRGSASYLITITTTPADATIIIDGIKVGSGSGTYPTGKGSHVIAAIKDGYYEAQQQLEINTANTQVSLQLEKKPPMSIEEILRGSGYTDLVKSYPILKNLPFQQFLYQIDYSPDSTSDNLIIIVRAYEGHRGAAIDKIKSWGLNPAEYNIVIEPFSARPTDYNYKTAPYINPFAP